jgi:hypothetical protein
MHSIGRGRLKWLNRDASSAMSRNNSLGRQATAVRGLQKEAYGVKRTTTAWAEGVKRTTTAWVRGTEDQTWQEQNQRHDSGAFVSRDFAREPTASLVASADGSHTSIRTGVGQSQSRNTRIGNNARLVTFFFWFLV